MKKIIAGLVAAFMLSAGFVAVSAETASAACKPSQYVKCPVTKTTAKTAKVKKGKKPKTAIVVKSAGNTKPKGVVTITYKGPGVNKKITFKYNGKAVAKVGPVFKKKGTYTITVSFVGTNTKNSKTVTKVKVK